MSAVAELPNRTGRRDWFACGSCAERARISMQGIHWKRQLAVMIAAATLIGQASAQAVNGTVTDATPPLRDFVPVTISPQAQAIYHRLLPLVEALRKDQKVPQTVADFDARYTQTLARAEASTEPALKALGVTDTYLHMGDVGVLETKQIGRASCRER